MNLEPMGDEAFLLRGLAGRASRVARLLNSTQIRGLVEASACFDKVALYIDPDLFDSEEALRIAESVDPKDSQIGKSHAILVCFELGEDLPEAAHRLGLEPDRLIEQFCSQDYECLAIGFCPGFPYLGPLPESLRGLPRRDQPRSRVPQGSVGMVEEQACIYPLERPGGWNLVGRCPSLIVDEAVGWFPIEAGDRIRFEPITQAQFEACAGQRL